MNLCEIRPKSVYFRCFLCAACLPASLIIRDGNDYSVNRQKDRNRLAILRFDYSLSFDNIWWKYLDLVTVFSIHKNFKIFKVHV